MLSLLLEVSLSKGSLGASSGREPLRTSPKFLRESSYLSAYHVFRPFIFKLSLATAEVTCSPNPLVPAQLHVRSVASEIQHARTPVPPQRGFHRDVGRLLTGDVMASWTASRLF